MLANWYATIAQEMAAMSAWRALAIVGTPTTKLRVANPMMNCPTIALTRMSRSAGMICAQREDRIDGMGRLPQMLAHFQRAVGVAQPANGTTSDAIVSVIASRSSNPLSLFVFDDSMATNVAYFVSA